MDGALKQEIIDLSKAILATFTKEYTKAYTIALVNKCIKDAKTPSKGYKLDHRDEKDTSDKFKGYLTKEGAVRKSWKRRYFIVRHDYSIDYYVDENNLKKAKGSINLAGYRVETDPNNSTLARVRKLAEKMKIDVSAIPKPKEYPPLTIELFHSSRRVYYLTAADQKEFDEWVEILKMACRYAWGFKNREPVHVSAFGTAVRNTRWSLGRWGWWSWGGSETQVLTDMICDEIEYDILGRALCKLPNAPWFIRNMLRSSMMKAIDGMVSGAVNPAWIAMDKTVTELRPTAEPKIREQVDPIANLQREVLVKMKDSVMSVLEPALKEHVAPHMDKMVSGLKEPIQEAFEESVNIWKGKVDEYKGDGSASSFSSIRWYPQYYWPMEPATKKIWKHVYPFLEQLYPVFKDFWASSVCWEIRDELVRISEDAVYTFEKHVTATGAESNQNDIKLETLDKFKHDVVIVNREQICGAVRNVVKPSMMKILAPGVKPILSTLQAMIPNTLSDFFDMDEMFNEVVDGVLNDSTIAVLGGSNGNFQDTSIHNE